MYTIEDMKKKESAHAFIRMDKALNDALKKEAKEDGRSLNNYVNHLLTTDPRRKKK